MTRLGWGSVLAVVLLLAIQTGSLRSSEAPIAPVDEPDICLGCHGDVAGEREAPHVHTAFASGKCSECHNPHASKHAALLQDEERDLCLSCHEEVVAEIAQIHPHEPAAKGPCGACHDPHASETVDQLHQGPPALCETCHPTVTQWKERARIHEPARGGECETCHATHGSEHAHLVETAVPGLCFECHASGTDFSRAHSGYRVEESDCGACHDPHSSEEPGLLRSNQHAPFAGGNCTICHETTGTGNVFAITEGKRELCLGCHSGVADYQEREYHHNLDTETSCMHCHNPHAANGSGLLAAEQELLCFRCHFEEGGAEAREKNLTHGGMDCSNCHVPHGSDDPFYLAKDRVSLCADCHVNAHRSSHPIGPEVIDPRTGESVTCLSCHELHDPPFADYLPLDPQMDLCIQCHRK
ncbi:MAG: hypothetical protein GF346_12375 [Candidatus Eisenbacteria bacterium]|nr:hypothetical protein [Candidatus Latescibacterota bacterium]MBD3303232.1 hypothetical protein [Candidatus Eisenbacteria bacterium]